MVPDEALGHLSLHDLSLAQRKSRRGCNLGMGRITGVGEMMRMGSKIRHVGHWIYSGVDVMSSNGQAPT